MSTQETGTITEAEDEATTVEPIEDPEDATSQTDQEVTEDATSQVEQEPDNPGREAAKYRRQLRDTETQLEETQTALTTLRKQVAESALENVLTVPASIWLTGLNVEEFYNEDGTLDVSELRLRAKELAAEHGLQIRRLTTGGGGNGVRGVGEEPSRPPVTWHDALRNG